MNDDRPNSEGARGCFCTVLRVEYSIADAVYKRSPYFAEVCTEPATVFSLKEALSLHSWRLGESRDYLRPAQAASGLQLVKKLRYAAQALKYYGP